MKMQWVGNVAYVDEMRSSYKILMRISEGSTPLISKPAIGHDPEPVPSTSHPHNIFP
jgi:hypothetical protein